MTERSIALVFGYLPDIDPLPKAARRLGLTHRFSVALDTYRSGRGEAYFDVALLLALLSHILPLFPHEEVLIGFDPGNTCRYSSWQEAAAAIDAYAAANENAPFDHMTLYRQQMAVCRLELEYYAAVGGPAPYHDTINYGFFVHSYDRQAVQAAIGTALAACNAAIRAVGAGEPRPVRSLKARLKRLL